MHPHPIHGFQHLEIVGPTPQVLVMPVVVAVLGVVGALPVEATVVPVEVVLVLGHGVPQMQMVQIQLHHGGDLLPVDGKVQARKLTLVGIGSPYIEKYLKMYKLFLQYNNN